MTDTKETGLVYRKKITAEVFAPYPAVAPKEVRWLGVIYGDLRGMEVGMSAYGPFVRLTGEFIAENEETKVRVTATSAILPTIAEQVLLNFLKELNIEPAKIGERLDVNRVAFGMDIGIEGRAKRSEQDTSSPYMWVIRPRVALPQSPVALLRNQFWVVRDVPMIEGNATETHQIEHNSETGEVPHETKKGGKKG